MIEGSPPVFHFEATMEVHECTVPQMTSRVTNKHANMPVQKAVLVSIARFHIHGQLIFMHLIC